MASAARHFVNLSELHTAVGKQIAEMLGCEAALVTAGAASALTLATAACVAGKDAEKIRRLPDTSGMKNEVIIQKAHRFGYDHAVRNVGVRLVEVETTAELERAVNARTAMMLFYNDFDGAGKIKVEEFARLGNKLHVPALNDAAADVPPVEHFTRYSQDGLRPRRHLRRQGLARSTERRPAAGPQGSDRGGGAEQQPERRFDRPHQQGRQGGDRRPLGRLRQFLKRDHAAVWQDWEKRVQTIADLVGTVKGVKTEPFVPPIANHTPHLRISWEAGIALKPAEVAKRLKEGTPHIEVRPIIGEALEVSVFLLEPGEERIVGERIRDLLKKA